MPREGKSAQKARGQGIDWLEKGIHWRVATAETDTDVRGLGAMEGCQAHLITDRMTDQGMSWCKQSARNLGQVIQLHAHAELGSYVGRQAPESSLERVSFSLFEEEAPAGLPACEGPRASRPWVQTIRGMAQDCQLNWNRLAKPRLLLTGNI